MWTYTGRDRAMSMFAAFIARPLAGREAGGVVRHSPLSRRPAAPIARKRIGVRIRRPARILVVPAGRVEASGQSDGPFLATVDCLSVAPGLLTSSVLVSGSVPFGVSVAASPAWRPGGDRRRAFSCAVVLTPRRIPRRRSTVCPSWRPAERRPASRSSSLAVLQDGL